MAAVWDSTGRARKSDAPIASSERGDSDSRQGHGRGSEKTGTVPELPERLSLNCCPLFPPSSSSGNSSCM
jgi:hypothetical protein